MEVKITERGWAGHSICADSCKFRRNTLIEYEDKHWIVSTVGALVVNIGNGKSKIDTIGSGNRYYETMAWKAKFDGTYWDVNIDNPIHFDSDWAVNKCEFASDQLANDMHETVVKELSEKIQEVNNDNKS